MKKCNSCNTEKHNSDFHKRKASKDGLAAKCKECQKEYDKGRANLPHRVESRKEYQKTDAFKESHRKANKKYTKTHGYNITMGYRDKNQKKYKVHWMVAYAIKTGLIASLPCEICGCEKSHAHHDDYNKPLNVRWLCPAHHQQWHAEHGEGANAQ